MPSERPSSSFPAWRPPRSHQSVCTDAQIDRLLADCFHGGGAADARCSQARNQTSYACYACYACIDSNVSDSVWGPLLDDITSYLPNYWGCVALLVATGYFVAIGPAVKTLAFSGTMIIDPFARFAVDEPQLPARQSPSIRNQEPLPGAAPP